MRWLPTRNWMKASRFPNGDDVLEAANYDNAPLIPLLESMDR